MLRSAAAEGDIVVAEVPERLMDRVKLGMTCEVRFYALPNRVFTGKVSGISPVISKDKRVLNVQFVVKDPQNAIRPGMFAQIGLGTDKRQSLLMPADGVLHVEDKDYALVGRRTGNLADRRGANRRVAGHGRGGAVGIEGRRSRAGPGGHPAEARRRPLPPIGGLLFQSRAAAQQRAGEATTDEPRH